MCPELKVTQLAGLYPHDPKQPGKSQLPAYSGRSASSSNSAVLQLNYGNKNMLMAAMIVAGWDERGGGQVFGVPISGTLVQEPWAIDGSGSTFIWGYLDSEFRWAAAPVRLCLTCGRPLRRAQGRLCNLLCCLGGRADLVVGKRL